MMIDRECFQPAYSQNAFKRYLSILLLVLNGVWFFIVSKFRNTVGRLVLLVLMPSSAPPYAFFSSSLTTINLLNKKKLCICPSLVGVGTLLCSSLTSFSARL